MISVQTCLVAGGDLRQYYLVKALRKKGYRVFAAFLENAPEQEEKTFCENNWQDRRYDVIIFPLPSDDETLYAPLSSKHVSVSEVLRTARKDTLVLGGKVGAPLRNDCAALSIEPIDYLEREEFAVLNAIPTAEGAVGILMGNLPSALFGSCLLVTGFGRIAKTLAKLLVSLGAEVTVAARKPADRSWARIFGCRAVSFKDLLKEGERFDAVINTVPALIFDKPLLSCLSKNTFLLDLASKPGGAECGDNLQRFYID